jgi:hypothetical protein
MEHYYYTKYVVPYGNKMYTLVSMDTMKYKAWRDEKLQKLKEEEEHKNKEAELKIREQEEAKKRDAEAAALLLVHVPSTADIVALKTDSKPRTVSLEEGEDDVEPPIFDVVYTTVKSSIAELTATLVVRFANTPYVKEAIKITTKPDFLFLFEPVKEKYKESRNYFCGNRMGRYFFGLPRPPEEITSLSKKSLPMDFLSMHACGWGPPMAYASRRQTN